MKKIGIDTRELSHPKPLEMAAKILQELTEETYLSMLHTKNPIPLLDLAKEHGYHTLSKENKVGDWQIIISKTNHVPLEDLLGV